MIQKIHDEPGRFVMSITGGGSSAIAALLGVPGASRTVIEATVPYDPATLAEYLGGSPDQSCSGKTARGMAMAAFQRAQRFNVEAGSVYGIGCTAALVTDRQRRGTDRCFVALQSIDETHEYTLSLSRQHRDRESQESACAELVLHAMATALGITSTPPVLFVDESQDEVSRIAEPGWRELFSGHLANTTPAIKSPPLVFPGAFNPMHEGHKDMIRIARARTGHEVLLEISAFNVDKPPLDYVEMTARQDGIVPHYLLSFTNAPTFVQKAELFPGTTFIVGSDTLERIGQPRYYSDNPEIRDRAMQKLKDYEIRFLVFGRLVEDAFRGLDEIEIPPLLRDLADGVSESEFRLDLSSSAIRRDQEQN